MQCNSILQSIPLFSHLNTRELTALEHAVERVVLPAGKQIEQKRQDDLYIVATGLLAPETALKKTGPIYFSRGSFFGGVPFAANQQRILLRTLTNVVLLRLNADIIRDVLLSSPRALRGYITLLNDNGFDVSDEGIALQLKKTRVTTVQASSGQKGVSTIVATLGRVLSDKGKSIILDMGTGPESVFSAAGCILKPALSQRDASDRSENSIKNLISSVDDTFDLLNVSYATKVKINPAIIAPLVSMLSLHYEYIIFDLGNHDPEVIEAVLESSDQIFVACSGWADYIDYGNKFYICSDAQSLVPVVNGHYSGNAGMFMGAVFFPEIAGFAQKGLELIAESHGKGAFAEIVDKTAASCRILHLDSQGFDAIGCVGLFAQLKERSIHFDRIYASGPLAVVAGMYLKSDSSESLRKMVGKILSPDKLKSLLEIHFPEDRVYSAGRLGKHLRQMLDGLRVELADTMLVSAMESENKAGRYFSGGELADLLTASLAERPLFKPVLIGDTQYFGRKKTEQTHYLRQPASETWKIGIVSSGGKGLAGYPRLWSEQFSDNPVDVSSMIESKRNIVVDFPFEPDMLQKTGFKRNTEFWKPIVDGIDLN